MSGIMGLHRYHLKVEFGQLFILKNQLVLISYMKLGLALYVG